MINSIREIEIIVGVVIIFSLTNEGTNHMDGEGEESDSGPDSDTEVDDESLDEELVSTTVEEMEEPLLGSIGSMMPDVASHVSLLLIEIVLSVPSSVLLFGYSETLSVYQSHVFHVSELIMSQTTTYTLGSLHRVNLTFYVHIL